MHVVPHRLKDKCLFEDVRKRRSLKFIVTGIAESENLVLEIS